jgi:uncharacterized protein YndB with AHSA1/START domain
MSSDREIVITRVFDAPRDLVFETFTDPKHVPYWWGPKGSTTKVHEMDLRPGGIWRLTMRGPDGVDRENKIVFIEVAKPERLVYRQEPEHKSEPVSFEVTTTFEEQGNKTKLTVRMVFSTAAQREYVATQFNAIEGVTQTLARLAEHLLTRQEVVITRLFDAPREMVFQAWTDQEQLKQWWGPTGFTNPVCELDPRPGGAIRIHMRAPDGVVYPMTGVVLEIVEPVRLVFTSSALDKDGNALFENLNSVTFAEQGGKTQVTLHAKVQMATEQAAPYLKGMDEGWRLTLDRLGEFVGVYPLPDGRGSAGGKGAGYSRR